VKQVIQNYKTGEPRIEKVPASMPKRGHALVSSAASPVSVGTEKYMLELAKKSLLGKALARPDLVRQVIAKAQAESLTKTYRQDRL